MPAPTRTRHAPKSRSRAPRTQPEERRAQILDVAEALLETGGSDALRMDSVARAAGVTRPVVYDHFENRDGLIIALLERHERRINFSEGDDDQPATSFSAVLLEATRAYLETSVEHGAAMRALVSGVHLSPTIEGVRSRIWNAGVEKWSERYRHNFSLNRRDAKALAVSHLAGLSALAGECIAGSLSVKRAAEIHVASAMAALRAIGAEDH